MTGPASAYAEISCEFSGCDGLSLYKLTVALPRADIAYRWGQTIPEPLRFLTSWGEDVQQIASARGMSLEDIVGPSRQRALSFARFEVEARLRTRGWSLPKIGGFLGGRDHTAVLHGLRRFEALVKAGEIEPVRFAERG